MGCKLITSLFFLLFTVGIVPLAAQTPVATAQADPQAADGFYRKALDAYLDGDYDQAILLVAQSLEKDPGYLKSKNLLSVLTSEKDQEGKTVIWLSHKPEFLPPPVVTPNPVQPTQDTTALKADLDHLQQKLNVFYSVQSSKNSQMNGQLKVMQDLVRENSAAQYDELKKSQIEIFNRLEKMDSGRAQSLYLLYILCGASIFFSVLAVLKNFKRVKQPSR